MGQGKLARASVVGDSTKGAHRGEGASGWGKESSPAPPLWAIQLREPGLPQERRRHLGGREVVHIHLGVQLTHEVIGELAG